MTFTEISEKEFNSRVNDIYVDHETKTIQVPDWIDREIRVNENMKWCMKAIFLKTMFPSYEVVTMAISIKEINI